MLVRMVFCAVLIGCAAAQAAPSTETLEEALCRLIEDAARRHDVPAPLLTRLIWRESSFRASVVSPAGAQGIAQFMPDTAQERRLADPFDPEQAIPKAAEFIAELSGRFGNLGLAAAAYNGGPARVTSWLAGQGSLPDETRRYVFAVTGRSAEEWASDAKGKQDVWIDPAVAGSGTSCLQIIAAFRLPQRDEPSEAPFAPWGVQLAGNFSKERALSAFARASRTYASVLGEVLPMVIGTRLRYRGARTFYRVRVPAESRASANQLCNRIRMVGGSCVVLPS